MLHSNPQIYITDKRRSTHFAEKWCLTTAALMCMLRFIDADKHVLLQLIRNLRISKSNMRNVLLIGQQEVQKLAILNLEMLK